MTNDRPSRCRPVIGFLRDQRGLAIVELAFVAPFLLVITCGVSDVALGFARRMELQQAASRAVELASAKGYDAATQGWAQSEAATAANVATANVTATTWLECGGVVQASVTGSCASGTTARYISIAVTDTYSSTFASMLTAFNAGNWASVPIRGFASARLQ